HAQPAVRRTVRSALRRQPERTNETDLGIGDGARLQAAVVAGVRNVRAQRRGAVSLPRSAHAGIPQVLKPHFNGSSSSTMNLCSPVIQADPSMSVTSAESSPTTVRPL